MNDYSKLSVLMQQDTPEEFKKLLKFLFPNGAKGHTVGIPDERNENILVRNHFLASAFRDWNGGPYRSDEKRLIYLCSWSTGMKTIQSGNLRIYSLRKHVADDPREFEYAAKYMNWEDEFVLKAQSNLFVKSFFDPELEGRLTPVFNMWRLFGEMGRGMAFIFRIKNRLDDWHDHFLGRVHYGWQKRQSILGRVKKLTGQLELLTTKERIETIHFLPFHKSGIFKLENEIRLVIPTVDSSKDNHFMYKLGDSRFTYPVIEKETEGEYLNLPLSNRHADILRLDKVPHLELSHIVLGFSNLKEVSKREELMSALDNYLPKPIVQYSKVCSTYYGRNDASVLGMRDASFSKII